MNFTKQHFGTHVFPFLGHSMSDPGSLVMRSLQMTGQVVCVRPFNRLIAVHSRAMSPIQCNVFQFSELVSWSNLCVKALEMFRVLGQVDVFIEFPAVLFKDLPAFCLFCQQSSCGLSGLRSVGESPAFLCAHRNFTVDLL